MRLVRRIVMVASLVGAAFGLTLVMLLASLHTDTGREIARVRLAALAAGSVEGRVSIGRLETPRPGRVVLHDVAVSRADFGVVRARRIAVTLGLPLPFPPVVRLRAVEIDGLVAHLVPAEEPRDTEAPEAAAVGLRIADLTIRDGRVALRVARDGRLRHVVLSPLSARASLAAGSRGLSLRLASLEAVPRGLPLEPVTAALTLRLPLAGGFDVASLAVTAGATRLAGTASVAPDGRVDARLDADPLAASALAPFVSGMTLPSGSRAALRLHGPSSALDVEGLVDLADGGRVALRGRVGAAGDSTGYRAALSVDGLVPGALRSGWPNEPIDGTLRGSGRDTRMRAYGKLATPAVDVTFRGHAALGDAGSASIRGSGTVRDLARLGGPAGRFPFRIEVDASGALPRPARARASAALGAGAIGAFAMTSASARAHLDRSQLRIDELRLEGDGLRLTAAGRADLDRAALEADVTVASEARGSATASLALTRARGAWDGTLRALTVTPRGLPSWTSEAPAALAFRDGVTIDGLRLRSAEQRVALSARVGPGEALTGALTVAELQLAPICTLAAVTCSGVARGRLDAAGRVTAPQLSLEADVRELAAGPFGRSRLDAEVRWEDGRASGRATLAGLGGSVVVAGSVPAPLPGLPAGAEALDLTMTARDLAITRLAQWAPKAVRAARGTVRGDVHFGGTWSAPRPEGTLALRASVLQLVASGARWDDVTAELRADGARGLVIERLTATGGRGTVKGTGRFDFEGGLVPSADVRLEFDRFLAVDRPVLQAAVNGQLRVTGPLDAPTVRGQLYVPDGAVRPAFLPASNAPTQRDPSIEVVGLPEDVTEAPAPALGDLTLGIAVTLGDGMRIRRRDANVQLGGTLHLERTPPEPLTVRGTVKVEEGWYTFSGRRFTMRSGDVRFDGGPVDGAQLDLEAMYRAGEYDVTVSVQGTIGKPELLLSSDPPLDEPDVLAVLLVGRPSGELSDSERLNVQAEAASLAMDYVAPGLGGGLSDVLPLEQVEVGPEQIRVGQHIGSDVFISLSQEFVGWAGQTMAVEYSLTRRLSVELSTSSRGSGAIDFFWRRRY